LNPTLMPTGEVPELFPGVAHAFLNDDGTQWRSLSGTGIY
jgi:hypothetical protein